MLQNYFKIAFRSLMRQRLYTLINIFGLAFGLACFILMTLYVIDEWRFDAFHEKADQLYRVVETQDKEDKTTRLTSVSFKLGQGVVDNFPEVENSCRLIPLGRTMLVNPDNQNASYQPFLIGDETFMQMFDFKLLEGDRKTALTEPRSIILSQNLAQILFGDENPMGKTIATDQDWQAKVTGIFASIPNNSHLQMEALFSFSTAKTFGWYERLDASDWSSNNFTTYLQLKPNSNAKALQDKLTAFIEGKQTGEEAFNSTFQLQALRDIHFQSGDIESDFNADKGNIAYIYIFSIIGFFILLIACINYMNLATARSVNYGREVGVRKAVGASRKNLIGRFLTESVVITAIALFIAANVVAFALPYFNTFTGKTLTLNILSSSWVLPAFLLLIVGVSLLSGSYPAFYLTRFQPAKILKGKNFSKDGNLNLRRSLVVFQFVLSSALIIGTLVAFSQMQYIQNKDLGFNQEELVVVDINSGEVRNGFETIKTSYEQLAAVKNVSVSSRVPGEWKVLPQVSINRPETGTTENPRAYFLGADADFLETFEMPLIKGRNFDEQRLADSSSILINEAAAQLLGIDEPNEQPLTMPAMFFNGNENQLENPFQAKVIGIVENFHFQSLHEELKPMIIAFRSNPLHRIDYFTVRLEGGTDKEATITALTNILQKVDPNHLFEYHFLDSQLALFYETDTRRSQIFSMAALFAIFIACLGLFGLATFMAEQRTKEIGIRKVLGASVSNIVMMLSKDFLKLVVIALLIASPLAWYAMQQWLNDFAYSVGIQWWMFVVPAVVAILIALTTVSFQAIKAALGNPVKALKTE